MRNGRLIVSTAMVVASSLGASIAAQEVPYFSSRRSIIARSPDRDPFRGADARGAAWFAMSSTSKVAASVVPPPQSVLLALWAQLQSGALIIDLLSSLGRASLGYAVSALIGVPLGLAMGTNPVVRALVSAPSSCCGRSRPSPGFPWRSSGLASGSRASCS